MRRIGAPKDTKGPEYKMTEKLEDSVVVNNIRAKLCHTIYKTLLYILSTRLEQTHRIKLLRRLSTLQIEKKYIGTHLLANKFSNFKVHTRSIMIHKERERERDCDRQTE